MQISTAIVILVGGFALLAFAGYAVVNAALSLGL